MWGLWSQFWSQFKRVPSPTRMDASTRPRPPADIDGRIKRTQPSLKAGARTNQLAPTSRNDVGLGIEHRVAVGGSFRHASPDSVPTPIGGSSAIYSCSNTVERVLFALHLARCVAQE